MVYSVSFKLVKRIENKSKTFETRKYEGVSDFRIDEKKIAIKCGNDKYEHKIGHIENGYVTVEYLDIIPSTIT